MDVYILIIISFFTLIPSFFWLWIYRLQDREQPEPRYLIRKLFFAGMLITIPAIFLEDGFIPNQLFGYQNWVYILVVVILTALIEELLKFFAAKKVVWKLSVFDQPIDGVIYSISVALGFALVENFFYFLPFAFPIPIPAKFTLIFSHREIIANFWQNFFWIFVSRFIFTTLMHTLASGVLGIYLGKAKFDKANSTKLIIKGLIWAIAFHALFNFFALLNEVGFTFFITLTFAVCFFPYIRKKECFKIGINRDTCDNIVKLNL